LLEPAAYGAYADVVGTSVPIAGVWGAS